MKKYFIAMMAAMLLSLPTWVKTVKANDLNDKQLDAVTGATPQTGGIYIHQGNKEVIK